MPPISKKPSIFSPPKSNGENKAPQRLEKTIYPNLMVNGILIPIGALRKSEKEVKELLGWETEGDYRNRITKGVLDPDLRAEREELATKGFGLNYLLKDEDGNKVRCWKNNINRPFDEAHARKIAQEYLKKTWACPTNFPGETVNGETVIISRTGEVESGQHRLVGYVLACQMHRGKNKHRWQRFNTEPPVFESLIVYGTSDDERIVRTLDNVKPRMLSDVVYSSSIFADLGPLQRKECARMLEKAVGLLWKRTGAGKEGSTIIYQTHSESVTFIDRHPLIKDLVKHIYQENRNRGISVLRLSPGECAGVCYLMGSCKSDLDEYRNSDQPSEEILDWSMLNKAKQFWTDLVNKSSPKLSAVREALATLEDEDGGGGRRVEKLAIISKAWAVLAQGYEIKRDDLKLHYHVNDLGNRTLLPDERSNFGGIDLGEKQPSSTEDPSEEEIKEQKEQMKEQRFKEQQDKIEQRKQKKEAEKKVVKPLFTVKKGGTLS